MQIYNLGTKTNQHSFLSGRRPQNHGYARMEEGRGGAVDPSSPAADNMSLGEYSEL